MSDRPAVLPALSVLFVCTANRCRSPFMERWSRHALGPDAPLTVSSAGTHARPGEDLSAEMRQTLERRGADVSPFRSRPVDHRLLDAADLVLTATRDHRALLLADRPTDVGRILTLGQATEAARTLPAGTTGAEALGMLARRRANPLGLDVDDPWGRGAEAAEACAATITSLLAVLLPVLSGTPVAVPTPTTPEP